MNKNTLLKLLGALFALTLISSACGSESDADNAATGDTDPADSDSADAEAGDTEGGDVDESAAGCAVDEVDGDLAEANRPAGVALVAGVVSSEEGGVEAAHELVGSETHQRRLVGQPQQRAPL